MDFLVFIAGVGRNIVHRATHKPATIWSFGGPGSPNAILLPIAQSAFQSLRLVIGGGEHWRELRHSSPVAGFGTSISHKLKIYLHPKCHSFPRYSRGSGCTVVRKYGTVAAIPGFSFADALYTAARGHLVVLIGLLATIGKMQQSAVGLSPFPLRSSRLGSSFSFFKTSSSPSLLLLLFWSLVSSTSRSTIFIRLLLHGAIDSYLQTLWTGMHERKLYFSTG
jgi:hypothetical protein